MKSAVEEGLFEECGLRGNASLIGIRRYLVVFKNKLVEDKIFFIHEFKKIRGEISKNRDGEYFWVNLDDCLKIANPPLPELNEVMGILSKTDKDFFKEIHLNTNTF